MGPSTFSTLVKQWGIELVDSGEDSMVLEMPVTEAVINTAGSLQGGLIATLVDIAAGRLAIAVRTDGLAVTTATLTLNYVAPITIGPARAHARVLRSGRRQSVVEVKVHDTGRAELCAAALVTFAVVPRRN
jgi:uncharacterized protein (TIGR00369 family)